MAGVCLKAGEWKMLEIAQGDVRVGHRFKNGCVFNFTDSPTHSIKSVSLNW